MLRRLFFLQITYNAHCWSAARFSPSSAVSSSPDSVLEGVDLDKYISYKSYKTKSCPENKGHEKHQELKMWNAELSSSSHKNIHISSLEWDESLVLIMNREWLIY